MEAMSSFRRMIAKERESLSLTSPNNHHHGKKKRPSFSSHLRSVVQTGSGGGGGEFIDCGDENCDVIHWSLGLDPSSKYLV
jgi:hypothetical protein